jgi:hypothetical protein
MFILFLEFDFIQIDSRPLKVFLTISPGILTYRSEIGKVRHFYQNFQHWLCHKKKVFFANSDASRCGFEKVIPQILLINLNHHLFLKF